MAIKMIENDGQIFYRVRVVKRSSQDPSLCAIRCVNEIKSFSEAQKIERKLIAQTERALLEKEHQCAKWETLIKEWQEATLKGDIFTRELTQGTVKDYVRLLTDHTKNWLNLPTTEITKAMALQAMDAIEREISVTRRKKLRSAIDAVFSWAYLAGKIKGEKSIPTEGYKSTRKEEEKMPEILSIEEIRILLKTARDMNHEWYHIWALALLTGMRSGELYALKWKKVDFDAQLIYVQDAWTNKRGFGPTKARYWRTVPIGGSERSQIRLSGRRCAVRGRWKACWNGRGVVPWGWRRRRTSWPPNRYGLPACRWCNCRSRRARRKCRSRPPSKPDS